MSERVNAYRCGTCGALTVTRDADEGVTPAMLGCRATPGCRGTALSAFYRPPADCPPPEWEWYRPTAKQARRADRKAPGMFDHFAAGGLFIRRIARRPA